MPSVGQTMQNGDNYLKDGHLMPLERPGIDVPPSLVVLSLVTNIVTVPVHTGVRAAGGSRKLRVISSSIDGRPMPGRVEAAGSALAFNHSQLGVRYSPAFLCCSDCLPYYSPPSSSPRAVFVYRNKSCVLMTVKRVSKTLCIICRGEESEAQACGVVVSCRRQ